MFASLSRPHRIRKFHPLAAMAQRLLQEVSHAVGGGPRTLNMLLISDGINYTSEQQFAPIKRHARLLRTRLGLVFEHLFVDEAMHLDDAALARFQLVGLKLSFKTPAAEAARIVSDLRRRLSTAHIPLIYFDGDDDLNVQWPEVIGNVDAYVKKHVFSDPQEYLKSRIGKSNLTDYVAREHGRTFADDGIPATRALPAATLPALHLGWNIGLDDKIVDLRQALEQPAPESKDIDIATRAFVKPEVWIYPLRSAVVDRIEEMGARYRVLAPRDRVSQEQYYEELKRARICVSPFGYGELCWRDFEAILCGCLLVKPDMGHARTYPDIFVPGQTYAPVLWDYSDLAEVCARYLDDEDERRRISDNARRVLLESMAGEAFATTFASLVTKARANGAAARAAA